MNAIQRASVAADELRQPQLVVTQPASVGATAPVHAPALVETLWARRRTFTLTMIVTCVTAVAYLFLATRVYTATSRLYLDPNSIKVSGDPTGYAIKSENFLFTQAEIIRSAPILKAALSNLDVAHMKTFAKMEGDPIRWLRSHKEFLVEVGKKDDIVNVSMDSPYAQEAADFVNAVVHAFVESQSQQKRQTGAEMTQILEKEKQAVEADCERQVQALLKFKQENGALSFRDDKGNIIVERLATLSSSLTAAELATVDLRAQLAQAKAIVADPQAITAFAQNQQTKGKDFGDRAYDELRSQLQQLQVQLTGAGQVLGAKSRSVQIAQTDIDTLKQKIAEKEKAIAEANQADIARQLAAAEDKERQVRAAFEAQQKDAMALNAKAAECARLEANVERAQKQLDLLDTRIKEVNVNTEDAGRLNVQVIETARAEDRPSKPRKTLILAAALLLGGVLGTVASLLQDWRDKRLHTPEDATNVLGLPVIGMVPRIKGSNLSLTHRGQLSQREGMSEAAEAYRTLRTAIHFGSSGKAKTILVTSPTPGDGKSTTASNIAIVMAQAGYRTLLIDADLRKPVQHKIFEEEQVDVGLTSVLAGRAQLRKAVRRTGTRGLHLLPCGPLPATPAEMVASKRFEQVLAAVSRAYDRIVIDSPPVLAVADARIIAASADATLLVLRMQKSTRKLAALAVEGLHSVGANVLGWVANDMPHGQEGYYGYGAYEYGTPGGGRDRLALDDESQDAPPTAEAPAEETTSSDRGRRRSELPTESLALS